MPDNTYDKYINENTQGEKPEGMIYETEKSMRKAVVRNLCKCWKGLGPGNELLSVRT